MVESVVNFNAKHTIIPSLNDFLDCANDLLKNSTNACKYNVSISIQFVCGIIKVLETSDNATSKLHTENVSRNTNHFKLSSLNKELQKHEQIKHDVQTKISRKNQIEHHFSVVERQLQFAMKKKIMKSEAIIVAAMKEHEHKMVNLELDSKNILSLIESNTKNSEMEKNSRLLTRNNLKSRKARIVHTYDTEMMDKYKRVNELNLKIRTIENSIYQLQESINHQMPFYNAVILEKEEENDRIWHAKLYAIQRKIAARKIQMHFRRYLNFIKTRDSKKTKKGQKKQSKNKNN